MCYENIAFSLNPGFRNGSSSTFPGLLNQVMKDVMVGIAAVDWGQKKDNRGDGEEWVEVVGG